MEHPIRLLTLLLLGGMLYASGLSRNTIAWKIYRNECAANPKYLIHWNRGESFPSLGIGHFIWYPEGVQERFGESFPQLVRYLQHRHVTLPEWLYGSAPWHSPREMYSDPRSETLRKLLQETMPLQADFLFKRLDDALPRMLKALSQQDRTRLLTNYRTLAKTPQGRYILVDYRNFKGDGTDPKERYNAEGWGLRDVLLCMPSPTPQAFVTCAKKLLDRRIRNAPPSRHEARWRDGWFHRLDTYL